MNISADMQWLFDALQAESEKLGRKLYSREYLVIMKKWKTEILDEEWTTLDQQMADHLMLADKEQFGQR